MAATIEFVNGRPRLGIVDPDGNLHGYDFRVGRLTSGLWQCEFVRLDSQKRYAVLAYPDGSWSCQCPDMQFGGPQKRDKVVCKHIAAARELQQLALYLSAQDEDTRRLVDEAREYFTAGYAGLTP